MNACKQEWKLERISVEKTVALRKGLNMTDRTFRKLHSFFIDELGMPILAPCQQVEERMSDPTIEPWKPTWATKKKKRKAEEMTTTTPEPMAPAKAVATAATTVSSSSSNVPGNYQQESNRMNLHGNTGGPIGKPTVSSSSSSAAFAPWNHHGGNKIQNENYGSNKFPRLNDWTDRNNREEEEDDGEEEDDYHWIEDEDGGDDDEAAIT